MAGWSDKYKRSIDCDNPKGFSQRAHCQGKKKKVKEENNPRIPRKPGQPANSKKHSDLYTDENPKGTIHGLGFKDVATAKASVTKIRNSSRSHAHKIQAAVAMEQRAREMGKTSEAAVFRKYINTMKKKTKEMNEEKKNGRCKAGQYYCYTDKVCKPIPKGFMVDPKGMLRKENGASIDEEGLRDWFGKSKSKDGKSGWVNVVTGGTCASDEPGEGTPKCVSSAKRASMSKAERLSASRRKKKADPNQQSKTGAAKPTYVSTDPKKKMKKEEFVNLPLDIEVPSSLEAFNAGLMFRESLGENCGMLFVFNESGEKAFYMKNTTIPLDIAFINEHGVIETIKELEPLNESSITSDASVLYALEVNRGWFEANNVKVGDKVLNIDEAKDKKGKGSGTKDACYHKVKSRYSVWPSAYASGALVKCRKVGAANWGNSAKKEGFSPAQLAALESIGAIEINEAGKKCWKGYKKAGTQKLFGKTYNRCVKAEETTAIETADGKSFAEVTDIIGPANMKPVVDTNGVWKGTEQIQEAVRLPAKTGNIIAVSLVWKGKYFMIRMFFPHASRPTRLEVQTEIEKVYPGSKLSTFTVSDYEPGQPLLQVAEGAAWTKKSGKNPKGGLNEKGRKSYERENPGSDLKAPSKKVGNPRRASFCARMKGMKAKLTSSKTANDPNSRINKSLRAWNC